MLTGEILGRVSYLVLWACPHALLKLKIFLILTGTLQTVTFYKRFVVFVNKICYLVKSMLLCAMRQTHTGRGVVAGLAQVLQEAEVL